MNRAPRKTLKRYEVPGQARFLTFSTFQLAPLFTDTALCDAFAAHLNRTRASLRFGLLAWVLMPDHVHLLLVPSLPDGPVSLVLHQLKMGFARKTLTTWRRTHDSRIISLQDARGNASLWQRGGGYDRNVDVSGELAEKTAYIHANPIRKGLCAAPHDWPWSSAGWYASEAHRARALVPIDSHLLG